MRWIFKRNRSEGRSSFNQSILHSLQTWTVKRRTINLCKLLTTGHVTSSLNSCSCAGEVGLLVCPVSKLFPVEGYVGKKELTEKKMLRNVLKDGDLYFNSGDLLMQDEDYYLYFKDRLGDTFR